MALQFWRAINPASKDSGIWSVWLKHEITDFTVTEIIKHHRDNNPPLLVVPYYNNPLFATFDVLSGQHYFEGVFKSKGEFCRCSAKGALDYLIFPLVARKLILDSYLPERQHNSFMNLLAWMVAIPLELIRFSAAIALTLLLAPIVALIRLIQPCLINEDSENAQSIGMTAKS